MSEMKPLSQFGIGPWYAGVVSFLTMMTLVLNHFALLPVVHLPFILLPARILAVLLVLSAALLWFNAVVTMNITKHIRENKLVTTGAYAWVRNPIYSAIMLVMWGLLLWSGNLLLLILAPCYHLLMTFMVKATEEKWLTDRYGAVYLDYCHKVNRCIPWFPHEY